MSRLKLKQTAMYAGLFALIIGGMGKVFAYQAPSFRAVVYTQIIKSDTPSTSGRLAQNDSDRLNTLFDDDQPGGFMDSALKNANLPDPINLDPKAMDSRLGTLRHGIAAFDRSNDVFTISVTWNNQDEAQRIAQALQNQYIKLVGTHESFIVLDPKSLANLNQLELATIEYIQNDNFRYPTLKDQKTFVKQLAPYLTGGTPDAIGAIGPDMFNQPGQQVPYGVNTSLSDQSMAKVKDPALTVLFYETVPDKDGNRYVGYADGDCKVIVASDWDAAKKVSGIK